MRVSPSELLAICAKLREETAASGNPPSILMTTPFFPPAGGGLGDISHADMVDGVLALGVKSGYTFAYTPTPNPTNGRNDTYLLNADPTVPQRSGSRYFFSDPSGVVRAAYGVEAGPSDSPID